MSQIKTPSFVVALKNYFGHRTGMTPTDFMKEVKALSYEEKCQFHRMLVEQAKIPCDAPVAPATMT